MPIATNFKFTQETAAALWTIKHNLGVYPILDVYVLTNNGVQKIMPGTITYVDKNTCTVSFSTPYSGFALVV